MKIIKFLGFVILPVLMTTSGEFMLKHSINTAPGSQRAAQVQSLDESAKIEATFSNRRSVIAICLVTLGGILWIVAMSKYELSFIYPYLSINYVSIVVGSQWILGESVSLTRYLSVIFIILGLVLISRSPNSEVAIKETVT